jgi:flagellar biosynthetic protein FlhB
MSKAADSTSKTEEPTEKRLRDAIEKGNTPFSREAAILASLVGIIVVCKASLEPGALRIAAALEHLMHGQGRATLATRTDILNILAPLAVEAAHFLLGVAAVFLVLGIAASMAQNMPRVTLDRIAPKLARLSPAAGFQRIFGFAGQIEFGKSLLKLLAMGLVAALTLKAEAPGLVGAIQADPGGIPGHVMAIVSRLVIALTFGMGAIVAADIAWARLKWRRDLRMTKQDVKDETKEAEGDPIVRARMRSIALHRVRKRMMAAVPRATLVIANPTHVAIALRYRRGESAAPVVLAKGKDLIALRIREIAEQHDIPVIEDKALARSMVDSVAVDQLIPPEFYQAVAAVIHVLGKKVEESVARRSVGPHGDPART